MRAMQKTTDAQGGTAAEYNAAAQASHNAKLDAGGEIRTRYLVDKFEAWLKECGCESHQRHLNETFHGNFLYERGLRYLDDDKLVVRGISPAPLVLL